MGGNGILNEGTYEIVLGDSFYRDRPNKQRADHHTIRYDFKPASVDENNGTIEFEDDAVTLTHPTIGTTHGPEHGIVYKGSKRPTNRECIIIVDNENKRLIFEKISSVINLKRSQTITSSSTFVTSSDLVKTEGGNDTLTEDFKQGPKIPADVGEEVDSGKHPHLPDSDLNKSGTSSNGGPRVNESNNISAVKDFRDQERSNLAKRPCLSRRSVSGDQPAADIKNVTQQVIPREKLSQLNCHNLSDSESSLSGSKGDSDLIIDTNEGVLVDDLVLTSDSDLVDL